MPTNIPSSIGRKPAWKLKRDTLIRDLMQQEGAPLSISLIKKAADSGDQEAIDIFIETGEVMGLGFATLINIFNPEKVILGGPLSIIGDYLLPAISAQCKEAYPV